MTYLLIFTSAAAISYVACRIIMRIGVTDKPNMRSSHTRATPTLGGAGIITATVIVWLWWRGIPVLSSQVLLYGTLAAGMGLIDDMRPIPPLPRLLFLAVLSYLSLDQLLNLPLTSVTFWALFVLHLGFVNAINFLDGINGIVAAVLIVGLPFLMINMTYDTVFGIALIGALAGFLVLNLRGKIFMGDTGALFLGFLLPLVGLDRAETGMLVIPVLAMGHLLFPILADISVTTLQRLWARKSVLQPHRDFYFLRLVDAGLSHIRVAVGYATLIGAQGALSLLFPPTSWDNLTLLYPVNGLMYGIILWCVHRLTRPKPSGKT